MPRRSLTLLTAGLALAGCTSAGSPASEPSAGDARAAKRGTSTAADQGCRSDYAVRPLPAWARAGFRPPTLPMPYVLSDKGDIVAILWEDHHPLVVPPARKRNNKILWVSRRLGAPLVITAELAGSGRSATRTVEGGPGPSVVDLPAPGCWSFDLTWGEHRDHLELEYLPR